MNSIRDCAERFVGVAAENTFCASRLHIGQGAFGDFGRQPLPTRVQPVEEPRKTLAVFVELLKQQIQLGHKPTHHEAIAHDKLVELVAVYGEVLLPLGLPHVFLVNVNPDEVRHHVCETVVVVAFYPDHFYPPLRVRELPDEGEEMPVVFSESPEIEIAKDVAEENQATKDERTEQSESFSRSRGFGSEMQIRDNHNLVNRCLHAQLFWQETVTL